MAVISITGVQGLCRFWSDLLDTRCAPERCDGP